MKSHNKKSDFRLELLGRVTFGLKKLKHTNTQAIITKLKEYKQNESEKSKKKLKKLEKEFENIKTIKADDQKILTLFILQHEYKINLNLISKELKEQV